MLEPMSNPSTDPRTPDLPGASPGGPTGGPAEGPSLAGTAGAAASLDSSTLLDPPGGGGGHDRGPSPIDRLLLGLALVLGAIRFVRLGKWSLWYDEVLTWGDAHSLASGHYNDAGYLLVRWAVELLGQGPTEAALRLLPALAGYAAVPLAYWAFRPFAGPRRSAVCALVVAVSAWELQWSQTARFYTLCQAVGLLGTGVWVRGYFSARAMAVGAGIVLTGLGVVFQLQAAILAVALGTAGVLFPLSELSHQRRAARIAFLVAGVVGLAGIPYVIGAFGRYASTKEVATAFGSVSHLVLSTGSFVTPSLGMFALVGLILGLRAGERTIRFVGAVPIIGFAVLTGLATQATVTAQYFLAFFPWVALLAAWPVGGQLLGPRRTAVFAWLGVLVLPQLAECGLYMTVQRGQRPRWREAVEYVAERREPTDVVVALPATVVEFYLTGAQETAVRIPDSVVHLDGIQVRAAEFSARAGRTTWIVLRSDYLLTFDGKSRKRLTEFLRGECRFEKNFPVLVEGRDLSIQVWRFGD